MVVGVDAVVVGRVVAEVMLHKTGIQDLVDTVALYTIGCGIAED